MVRDQKTVYTPGDLPRFERMRLTFDLFEASVQMQRLNLRRRYPAADEEEIERRLTEWLHTRPGAEHGDASGPHFRVRERTGPEGR